jgi:hypothetical protein
MHGCLLLPLSGHRLVYCTCLLLTQSGHASELIAMNRRKGNGRICAGVRHFGFVEFDLDSTDLSRHILNRRHLELRHVGSLSAALNVASGCSCQRHPNTVMRAICVTTGNARPAIIPLRLPFVPRAGADVVGPTSNDLQVYRVGHGGESPQEPSDA